MNGVSQASCDADREDADHEQRARQDRRTRDERGEPGPPRQHPAGRGRREQCDDRGDPHVVADAGAGGEADDARASRGGGQHDDRKRTQQRAWHRRVRPARERLLPPPRRRLSTGPVQVPRRDSQRIAIVDHREGGDGVDERPDGADRRRQGVLAEADGQHDPPRDGGPAQARLLPAERDNQGRQPERWEGAVHRQEWAPHRRQDHDHDPDERLTSTPCRPQRQPRGHANHDERVRPPKEARGAEAERRPAQDADLERQSRYRLVDRHRVHVAEGREGLAAQQSRQMLQEGGKRHCANVGQRDRHEHHAPRRGPAHRPPVAAEQQVEQQHAGEQLADDGVREDGAAGGMPLPLEEQHGGHGGRDEQEVHVPGLQGADDARAEEHPRRQPDRLRAQGGVEPAGNRHQAQRHAGQVEGEPQPAELPEVRRGSRHQPGQRQERRWVLVDVDEEGAEIRLAGLVRLGPRPVDRLRVEVGRRGRHARRDPVRRDTRVNGLPGAPRRGCPDTEVRVDDEGGQREHLDDQEDRAGDEQPAGRRRRLRDRGIPQRGCGRATS